MLDVLSLYLTAFIACVIYLRFNNYRWRG